MDEGATRVRYEPGRGGGAGEKEGRPWGTTQPAEEVPPPRPEEQNPMEEEESRGEVVAVPDLEEGLEKRP